MPRPDQLGSQVFTANEIARAAGVPLEAVRALLAGSEDISVRGSFVAFDEAVRLVRHFQAAGEAPLVRRRLFAPAEHDAPRGGLPLAASGALHLIVLVTIVLITGLGVRSESAEESLRDLPRLVFISSPGPGGGGGGGGLRQPLLPSEAKLKGTSTLRSPVVVTRRTEPRDQPEKRSEMPPPSRPEPEPEPRPVAPQPDLAPPVVAPVLSAPSDPVEQAGVPTDAAPTLSNGPGMDGGAGIGRGTGVGEGPGAGIGPGSTAGVGGGPYRAGAGITPPAIQHEVKPAYTDQARHRGIQGEVVMSVIVRADGTVGNVNVLRGLGAGLDQRAIDAVRQWRFSPARRFGTPVDVVVEIAVEFRLR